MTSDQKSYYSFLASGHSDLAPFKSGKRAHSFASGGCKYHLIDMAITEGGTFAVAAASNVLIEGIIQALT